MVWKKARERKLLCGEERFHRKVGHRDQRQRNFSQAPSTVLTRGSYKLGMPELFSSHLECLNYSNQPPPHRSLPCLSLSGTSMPRLPGVSVVKNSPANSGTGFHPQGDPMEKMATHSVFSLGNSVNRED